MTIAEQKALQSLAVIRSEVDALGAQVEVVVKSAAIGVAPAQQQLKLLHELMTQTLLKLDRVSGDGEIRLQRKAEVRRVEDLSSQLDRAAQGPAGRDPSAAVSAPVAAPAPVSEKEPELASKQEVGHLNGPDPLVATVPPPPALTSPTSEGLPPGEPSPSITQAPPVVAVSPTPPAVPVPQPEAAQVSQSPATSPRPVTPPVVPASSSPPSPTSVPLQKSPGRPSGPAMALPPGRQPGEDVRKKAAGMISHALSFSDGLAPVKPPPIEKRQSLASSASAAYVFQQQAPRSTPAPTSAPSSQASPPLVPTISGRLDNLTLAAAPAPVPHTGSLHDLDSFFGGGTPQALPAAAPAQTAPASQPNFADFGAVGQVQQPAGETSAPPVPTQSPAQSPTPVQYPAPKLSFPSPPKPALAKPAPPAERSFLPGPTVPGALAPPAPRRSSSAVVNSDGPPSYKGTSPSSITSPQEPVRPQRGADSGVPVLGNLSSFASPVPPSRPSVKETEQGPPTSPVLSSFSPPAAALSSFSADLPSPATRSTLTRPPSTPNLPQASQAPPAVGVRSSLQATSIEEALRSALSRRESVTKASPPNSYNAKAEPAPKAESTADATAQPVSAVAPKVSAQPTSARSSPAGSASSSSWVAFDSDFDPRAFSSSNKSSPSASRRSSYDLPPPPRPAQPLFPEVSTSGRPAHQGTAEAASPMVSLLDDPPPKAEAPAPDVGRTPPPPQPGPPASVSNGPSTLVPPQEQPSVSAPLQHSQPAPQPALSGQQGAFAATFPTNFATFPQPASSTSQGGGSTQQGGSQPGAGQQGLGSQGNGHTGFGQPGASFGQLGSGQPGFGQPGPSQQGAGLAGQQRVGEHSFSHQGYTQQWGGQQGLGQPGFAGPSSQAAAGSLPQQGSGGSSSQQGAPAPAPASVSGSGPLEGFGETVAPQRVQPPVQPAYGAGWPQQGFAGNPQPGFGGVRPQGFLPQGYAAAPGFGQGPAAQQGPSFQYRPQGPAPWLQQSGAPAAGFGGFSSQVPSNVGGLGQAWPYQQTMAGGYYQQQNVGGGAPQFTPSPQQAPSLPFQPNPSLSGGAYQAPPAAGSAWRPTGAQGEGAPPPAILPPWMIQPQQQAPSGGGSQGQGW